MHNAPSVSYPVGRCAILGGGALAAWVCAGGVCVAAGSSSGWSAWQPAALLGVWLACGLPLLWGARRQLNEGVLAWDGMHWHWQAEGRLYEARLGHHLDGQSLILLQLTINDNGRWRSRWGCLRAAAQSERWVDLRRALCADAAPMPQPKGRA